MGRPRKTETKEAEEIEKAEKPARAPRAPKPDKTEEKNTKMKNMVSVAVACMTQTKVSPDDPEEIERRALWYLSQCQEKGIAPGQAGLANAWGVSTRTLRYWRVGTNCHNPQTLEIIDRYMNMLEHILEMSMQEGVINPVSGIFLLKNQHGYKDVSDINYNDNAQQKTLDSTSREEIEKKYLKSIEGASDTVEIKEK